MPRGQETVDLQGSLLRESAASIRVRIDDEEYILPASQISWSETGKTDDDGNDIIELTIPEWLAMDRGII